MRNWYARYPGDLMRDTQHLTCEQFGAYDRLMDFYYSTGKPIPDDLDVIKRLLGESKQKTRKILLVLRDFFEEKNGFLHHSRIEEELEKARKINTVRRKSGRQGGQANAKACPQPQYKHSIGVPPDFEPDQASCEFLRFRKILFEKADIDLFIQHYSTDNQQHGDWQAMFRKWMLRAKVFKATGGNKHAKSKQSSTSVFAEGTTGAFGE